MGIYEQIYWGKNLKNWHESNLVQRCFEGFFLTMISKDPCLGGESIFDKAMQNTMKNLSEEILKLIG